MSYLSIPMSLLHRFPRTLRPTSLNPTTSLRSPTCSRTAIDRCFFTPRSFNKVGLGSRFYSLRRITPSSGLNMYTIYGFIGINTGVFLYGQYAKLEAGEGSPQRYIDFMENMTLNTDMFFREQKWWTIMTACFTHTQPLHLLSNLVTFYFIGQLLAFTPTITPMRLITLTLGSGLAGSAYWLYNRSSNATGSMYGMRDYMRGLGFSGCVMGIGTVAAFLHPREKFYIYGVLPMPLWVMVAAYAAYDGYYLSDPNATTGHAGHLGGSAFGVLYFLAMRFGFRVHR